MPHDIPSLKVLDNERVALIGALDQVAAKVEAMAMDGRMIASLANSGTPDAVLASMRDKLTHDQAATLWSLHLLLHRQKRFERATLELQREEQDALAAAIASIESQYPDLKGGLD